MRKYTLMVMIIIGVAMNVSAQEAKPPLSILRIAGETVAGELIAGVILVPMFVIVGILGGVPPVVEMATAGTVMAAGSSAGVWLIGSIGKQTGAYWASAAGGAVGVLVGLLLDFMIFPDFDDVFTIFSPTIGSVVGFNLSRRYK